MNARPLALVALVACQGLQTGLAPSDAPAVDATSDTACASGALNDNTNCGVCGRRCGSSDTCVGGVCVPSIAAPRPIAPLSNATVRTRRPTFRWALTGGDGAQVELCQDRAMSVGCARFDAPGTSGAPTADLAPGLWFWRVTTRIGGVTTRLSSPTWQLRLGTVDSARGSTFDYDGDGLTDLAVGAPRVTAYAGRVYVYRSPGPGVVPATVRRAPMGGEFGSAVANAGDVDRDGFADLAVGAPVANRAYVYHGGPMGLAFAPVVLSGGDSTERFGEVVSSAGDVNGDGYDDLAVTARSIDDTAGRVFVYLGGAEGVSTDGVITLTGPDASLFGGAVASAGDVNGDGYGDLVVGAHGALGFAGRAYVFHGSAAGLATRPSTTLIGYESGAAFGIWLARAGDVNGDGYADLAAAAPRAMTGAGQVFVFHGGAAGVTERAATTLTGSAPGIGLGGGLAQGADIDGDGYSDLLVGAPGHVNGTGAVFAYRGGARGVASAPFLTRVGSDGGDVNFGFKVSIAGDLNGDGRVDLVVSGVGAEHNTGRLYVYFGGDAGPAANPLLITGPDGQQNVFGWAIASAWRPRRSVCGVDAPCAL